MKKTKLTRTLMAAVSVVALSAVMYGCVHNGSSTPPPPVVEPEPTAYEAGKAAIAAATTAEEAQAAYDAVDLTEVSGAEAASLQMALNSRLTALATAGRVEMQKMALMTAAGMIDTSDLSTAEAITAAREAIAGLRGALMAAEDVSDADKAMYMSALEAAVEAVQMAQDGLDLDASMMAQRTAITDAVAAAQTAVNAVNDSASDADVTAADDAVAALKAAIDGATDLPAGDAGVASAQGTLAALMSSLTAAKTSRTAAMDAAEEEQRKAEEAKRAADAAAMAATAAKLHAGIYMQADDASGTDVGAVHAAYNDAGNPTGSDADTHIIVTIGDGTTANGQALSEDKDAPAATLHGWTRKQYSASGTDVAGTYEAHVYSHVGDPTEGEPFNEVYTLLDTAAGGVGVGEVGVDTATTEVQARVASSRFTQTAGKMEFELGTNLQRVVIPGMYHGVSGNFYCTPTDANTKCSSTVAADGYTLQGGTWAFKPGTATAKVMSTPDASYASYGWWLHTAADGDLTASAFVDRKGAVAEASGITALRGTATYMGGAVGKYALSSTTGGTNDAGHFTARATLNADFDDDMISGTIDNFMGVGGAKDWSVALKKTAVSDTGGITAAETVWTIGGTAADDSGSWTGSLQENGDDDVPEIATGTFYTEYGTAGKMVGAFGANKQ